MEYVFQINQLEIINHLIFDASIDLEDIEKMSLTNSVLEFEIERRMFENVSRESKKLRTITHINGMSSIIRFENIANLNVFGLTEQFKHNHFIDSLIIDNDGKLTLQTIYGLIVKMDITEKTKIILKDIRESEFGKGRITGKSGFTAEEWSNFLVEKNTNTF